MNIVSSYGGYPERAQKDIEGAKITWRNMHVILRELKIRNIQFSLFFSSKYESRVKNPRTLTFFSSKIPRELKIRAEKVSVLGEKTRDRYFEEKVRDSGSNFELSRDFRTKKSERSRVFDM